MTEATRNGEADFKIDLADSLDSKTRAARAEGIQALGGVIRALDPLPCGAEEADVLIMALFMIGATNAAKAAMDAVPGDELGE